jgi:hypothetical protein
MFSGRKLQSTKEKKGFVAFALGKGLIDLITRNLVRETV